MDNLAWHGGLMLKRFIEQSGRAPTLRHYAVAMLLTAREQDVDFHDLIMAITDANVYDEAAGRLDRDARIKQLGF